MVWFSPLAVESIQGSLRPLEPLMVALSRLGDGPLYIVALGFLYWCVDKRRGFRLGLLLLASLGLNVFAKEAFGAPRPPRGLWRDPAMLSSPVGGGFGFPSGHAQSAGAFWGGLALRWPRRWLLALGLVLIAGVSLSRVALGVHYPGDVAGGLLLAGVLLGLDMGLGPRLESRLGPRPFSEKLMAALAPGILALAMLAWRPNGDTAGAAGMLLGFPLGYVLEGRWVKTEAPRENRARGKRFVVGMALVVPLYAVGLLAGAHLAAALVSAFAMSLAASLGAPAVFKKMRL